MSCHQNACTNGIPYGQSLRLNHIYSIESEFVTNSKLLALHFHRANYPLDVIQTSFEEANLKDRAKLLISKSGITTDDLNKNDSLLLITTHRPTFHEVNNIVSSNLDFLDRSSSTRPILQSSILRSFRMCKNLHYMLGRAKIAPIPEHNSEGTRFNNECNRPYCIYCRMLNRNGRVHCSYTNKSHITRTKKVML